MARNSSRRLRTYLFRPRLPFRYALVFFFFASIGAGLAQLVSYLAVRRVLERILTEAGANMAALAPVIDVASALNCCARSGYYRSSASSRWRLR